MAAPKWRALTLAAAAAVLLTVAAAGSSSGASADDRHPHHQNDPPTVDCPTLEFVKIIPDVLKYTECRSLPLEIDASYGRKEAGWGAIVPVELTKDAPTVKTTAEPSEGTRFVLILTDPDAPSRRDPVLREWAHWVAVSCTGNFGPKSESPLAYHPPAPPPGTGLHRYVFLLYVQPEDSPTEFVSLPPDNNRARWGGIVRAQAFAAANNLRLAAVQWFFSRQNN